MKKTTLLLIFFFSLLLVSCNIQKKLTYVRGAESITDEEYANQLVIQHKAVIMPNDLITILVHVTEPATAAMFNPSRNPGSTSSNLLYKYLVDNNGYVQFPLLGEVFLKGLTRREAEKQIKIGLKKYIKEDPMVTVQIENYQVSVLGEVKSPGIYRVENEKVNVFEALALAGDMTIYGKRNNVTIMREEAGGEKKIITLNLNDKNIIYSPDFYLQQNDVLYVQPNKVRAQSAKIGPAVTLAFSSVGILISVANLVITLSKNNK